jgi:long-chain alkane monooxygenase
MPDARKDRLRFTMFTSFCPGGPPGSQWDAPGSLGFNYVALADWVKLAQALEAAKFDGIFWADLTGVHDTYQDSWETAVREAMQVPIGDPLILAATLAATTNDLGFVFSSNIISDHPYTFARKVSTLDHLSNGRVSWNVVTSFQRSAWQNMGHDDVDLHGSRYVRGQEYVDVVYKLLEGSWDDDAVVRDQPRRVYADPSRVHDIQHKDDYYSVPGINLVEPSPQRLPLLFQAGSSDDGRSFAALNAEAIFIAARNLRGGESLISDVTRRMEAVGRRRSDVLFVQHLNVVLGSTEEEARAKAALAEEYFSDEAGLAFASSTMGVDLSAVDLDTPLKDFKTEALQGQLKGLADAAPDKRWTFRDMFRHASNAFVGTPEQLADELAAWRDVGVDGINICHMTGTMDVYLFTEHAVPVLQERGLMQREYAPGTLREKMFAGTESFSGARVNSRHPAAKYRQTQAHRAGSPA